MHQTEGGWVPINEHDREEIRRIVVEEILNHLNPIHKSLETFNSWRLRIWNDNGGPPGYLQVRKVDDDKRNERIINFIETAERRQIEAEDREAQSEKRWQFWWPKIKWALGGLGTAFLGFTIWVGPKLVKVGSILVEDYLRYHPSVNEQLKTVGNQTDGEYPKTNIPTELSDGR
jgi:hypothetical protein